MPDTDPFPEIPVPALPPEGDLPLTELDYPFDDALIAAVPAEPRDRSRLMLVRRDVPADDPAMLRRLRFRHLPGLLRAGDLLVLNDTRVLAARVFLRRATGGRIEGLYLRTEGPDGAWRMMLKGAGRIEPGERLAFDAAGAATGPSGPTTPPSEPVDATRARPPALVALQRCDGGEWLLRPEPSLDPARLAELGGRPPLPPYIRRARADGGAAIDTPADDERYQTVFAARPGAVAAPTAGLHFTAELLAELAESGVRTTTVTLHVGAGTFAPVSAASLAGHVMHEEAFDLPESAVQAVEWTRAAGGRVIPVGTTAMRVLETAGHASGGRGAVLRPMRGRTRLLITPGFRFAVADGLVTNFHLPRSTLLALVMGLAGPERTMRAYRTAVEERWRFFSYGDAMLVL